MHSIVLAEPTDFWNAVKQWWVPFTMGAYMQNESPKRRFNYHPDDDVAESASIAVHMMPYQQYIWSGRNIPNFGPDALLMPKEPELLVVQLITREPRHIRFKAETALRVTGLFSDPGIGGQLLFSVKDKKGIIPVDTEFFQVLV
jgi:hypothetical protein